MPKGLHKRSSRISTGGDSAHPGDTRQCLETFLVIATGVGVRGSAAASDGRPHPTTCGTVPYKKNDLTPNVMLVEKS